MQTREVLLLLTDRFADWEAAYAAAGINLVPQYTVKTIAVTNEPKVSMGGLRTEIDFIIGDYHNLENLAMLILPGGFAWHEGRHDEIADFVRKVREAHIPVAAICGATIFLGKHGFLDKITHTGDDPELFRKEDGYGGENRYISAQIAVDDGFITANETAAVDFAHAIFGLLKIRSDEDIDAWRNYFKNGMA
ncbi:MAG: DJ-1/PfpI family protein [Defluviitaleaceae bacterium]|nr:DJ-1/PfpI family protein [Defluviitaleaceae bacterium]